MIISTLAAGLWVASLGAAAPAPFGSTSQLGALARRDNDLGSLVLIVKAQDDVNDPDDLTVSSCLLNNGNTTLKVLNDPNGPLSTWKTHTFEFYEVPASRSGLKARAGGGTAGVNAVRVKYNPEVVAALSDPNTYTVLKPGENKTVVHDLSGMYNFQTTGEYAVRLTANAEYMRIVKDDGSVGYIQAKMYDGTEAANWTATHVAEAGTYASMRGLINAGIPNHGSGSLFRRWEDESNLSKRQTYNNCSAAQQKDIEAGVAGANAYIDEVNKYLASAYYLANARYRTWFGPYTKTRWDTVKSHFTALHGQPARFRYDCSCTEADTFAFVYPNQFGIVYLCGAFWRATTLGQDSKAGTIIHEATHFTTIAGTDDHAYGHAEAQKLATNFPDQAVMNADSHEYFAENTPEIL